MFFKILSLLVKIVIGLKVEILAALILTRKTGSTTGCSAADLSQRPSLLRWVKPLRLTPPVCLWLSGALDHLQRGAEAPAAPRCDAPSWARV